MCLLLCLLFIGFLHIPKKSYVCLVSLDVQTIYLLLRTSLSPFCPMLETLFLFPVIASHLVSEVTLRAGIHLVFSKVCKHDKISWKQALKVWESLAEAGQGGLDRRCSVKQVGSVFILKWSAFCFFLVLSWRWLERNWEQLPGCFPCLLPLYQLIILTPLHSRVNTKEGEEVSGTCSEITGERATPVWRVGKNRIQIYPFCSYYFIVGCWSGTVPKESEVVEVTICCRKKGNCGKNTVVKNEVCISYAPTDLEMLPSGVMRREFCGLSLIHASPPGYIVLEMMYQKAGQHDLGWLKGCYLKVIITISIEPKFHYFVFLIQNLGFVIWKETQEVGYGDPAKIQNPFIYVPEFFLLDVFVCT